MPGAPDAWVLDTSALLCLKADEPGASEVDEVLRESGRHGKVFVSFMSLMEFYYIRQRTFGELEARKGYLELKQLPIIVVESDEELGEIRETKGVQVHKKSLPVHPLAGKEGRA